MLPLSPFVQAKSLFSGLNVVQVELDSDEITGVAAEADNDTFTKTSHGLVNGDIVVYVSGTGGTGLTALKNYEVRDVSGDTFKLAATIGGAAVDVTLDLTAGVLRKCRVFESRKLDHSFAAEYFEHKRPDGAGVLRTVRKVLTSSSETWVYEIDEAKRLPELFASALAGIKDCYITLWYPDPQDATGKVALKSERFDATIERDGDLPSGNAQLTIGNIKITSNKTSGAVTFTVDGDQ